MQLSHESYRVRWLVLVTVWIAVAIGLLAQTGLVRDYLRIAGGLGLRGATGPSTPLQQIYPAFAADALTWVRHAISLEEGAGPQLRYTGIDNAPDGREVHWNSAWAWTIALAGRVHELFTGLPLTTSTERATIWLTPLVMVSLIILISAWVTRHAGLIAGVFVIAAMSCTDRMYEGFFPGYVDHHGLLTFSVFAMMLGAIFMGGGWWQPKTGTESPLLPESTDVARNAAIFSGLSGACGLWVSAASVIPPIAIVGIAGLIVVLVQGRHAQANGMIFDPAIWRLWGRVGASASLFFYLLEYFPKHFSMRLEANHPLHALAWLGGGELIAQIGSRWLAPREARWTALGGLVWPLVAVAAVPAALLIGGAKYFVVLDPFMSNLHNRYIQEFLPLWVTMRSFNARVVFQIVAIDNLPLVAAIASLTYWRRESPLVLWFATLAAFFFNNMAWRQSRWLLNASGVQICLALVVISVWTARFRPRLRWLVVLAYIGVFYLPTGIIRYTSSRQDVSARRVAPADASAALFRDVALVLRNSQPEGEISVLASPNASTAIGYFGRFKTMGTLYWENEKGLKAAGMILGARTEEEAAKLIHAHKITHLAMIAQENFIAQYYELLHPNATQDEIKKCFGWRLMADKVVPQWLQMLPYKVPDDLAALNMGVMLFKVNFQQTMPEALYHVAQAQVALDGIDDAEKTFDLILKQYPQFSEPWLRKGEIQLRRHNWNVAAELLLKGVSLAKAQERPALLNTLAGAFYNQQQHAIAIQFYRRSLAETPNADAACYLAWVLATSSNDSLRNPAEALQLAQEALKADPNSATYLNTMAAALAENGKLSEAVATADRALANSRMQGRQDAITTSEQNLTVLRSGKPIRR